MEKFVRDNQKKERENLTNLVEKWVRCNKVNNITVQSDIDMLNCIIRNLNSSKGMISPSKSTSEGSGTTQGSDDSRDHCTLDEIILASTIGGGLGVDIGKVLMSEESLRSPTPTCS